MTATLMVKATQIRQAEWRQRQRAKGRIATTLWLDPAIKARLMVLIDAESGDKQDAANAVLARLLKKVRTP